MHTPHGGMQVTGLERAQLDEPLEYIQESQEPTVVLTPEQIAELETQLQNDRASPVVEFTNTDPRVATAQTAGLAQNMAEQLTGMEATLVPLTTGEQRVGDVQANRCTERPCS